MSSTPHSPPDTPSRPAMAVDNENLTPKVRSSNTPLKTAPKQSTLETPIKQSRHSLEVQVPSTLPHHAEDGPVDKEVLRVEQTRSDPSESLTEGTEEDHDTGTDVTEPESNAELADFDWLAFQTRYRDAIGHASDKEHELLQEFEKYFEVFRIWSLATSQRDGDRAWKRLRTRQRYVQLAEEKLEEKKQHYERVVDAFRNALELLN